MWFDKLGLVNEFPCGERHDCQQQHGVADEEIIQRPGLERGIPVCEDDERHPDETDVCRVWLEPALVRELIAVEALSFEAAPPEDVRGRHHNVVDDTGASNEIDLHTY